MVQFSAGQFTAIWCSAVQGKSPQYGAVQCKAVHCNIMQLSSVQGSSMQYGVVKCGAVHCNIVQCNVLYRNAERYIAQCRVCSVYFTLLSRVDLKQCGSQAGNE